MSVTKRRYTIHAVNALALSLFLAVHIAVNLSAWGGAETHAAWRGAARQVYQHPIIELGLVAVILMQVWTGLRMAWRRRRRWRAAQTLSGLYLAVFLLVHGSATIGTRRVAGLDTDFAWAAGSLAYGAVGIGFALYYGLALVSLVVHIGSAIAGMRRLGMPSRRLAVAGTALAMLVLLPFSPIVNDAPVPEPVRAYYHAMWGWTGAVPGPER